MEVKHPSVDLVLCQCDCGCPFNKHIDKATCRNCCQIGELCLGDAPDVCPRTIIWYANPQRIGLLKVHHDIGCWCQANISYPCIKAIDRAYGRIVTIANRYLVAAQVIPHAITKCVVPIEWAINPDIGCFVAIAWCLSPRAQCGVWLEGSRSKFDAHTILIWIGLRNNFNIDPIGAICGICAISVIVEFLTHLPQLVFVLDAARHAR